MLISLALPDASPPDDVPALVYDMMTTDFVEQRHATYTTPKQVLFDLVQQATGDDLIDREKIIRGYDNEVYAISTQQGNDYIVRIQRHGETGYTEEAWAIEQCRQAGAPVPEICHLGTVMIEDQPKPVMVQRRVAGRALAEMEHTLDQRELAHIYAQAGAALSQIHSIEVDGFYKRQSDGTWDFPDWASIEQSNLHARTAEQPQLRQAGFTQTEIDRLLAIVTEITPPLDPQPVLCHGDFHADHLFVDGALTLTAVIDFGEFQGGLPLVDFIGLSLEHPEGALTWLRAGYTNQAIFADEFAQRLRHAQASYLIGYLAHCVKIQDNEEVHTLAQQLRGVLAA